MEEDSLDDGDEFRITGLLLSCVYPKPMVTQDERKHTSAIDMG